jgi:hypothetical protein
MAMVALYLASILALLTAVGHSVLSERMFLRPLRAQKAAGTVFSDDAPKRLATAMFHFPSLCWLCMAASMLLLEPEGGGYRETLQIYAALYAISGLGNFWAVGRPHPGGILLLSSSALILVALYS